MPNPIELLTKPLQMAFGAIRNIQQVVEGLLGGDEPPPQTSHEPPTTKAKPRPKQLDDVTVTRKVETVLFRDDSVDKGKISVNTADGVVTLRGEDTCRIISARKATRHEQDRYYAGDRETW